MQASTLQQVTIVGCVQREADYRSAHNLGRGGAAGAGAGVCNEFVLVNASVSTAGTPTPGTGSATGTTGTGAAGEAYELTGKNEGQVHRRSHMATTAKPRNDVAAIAKELSRENTVESPVVRELRRQVANAFVLYANYKHYHWQTYGPLFRDLHKLFDRFAEDVLETLDPLAERVRMIGQDPPAHPIEMTDLASVAVAAPLSTLRDMVEEADRNALIVVKEMRHGAGVADDHEDPGTVDLFSRLVQVHEKHEWWLRDMLRKGDGLCT